VLSVYGGKITTYRKLSDDAMKLLSEHLSVTSEDWTRHQPLPGGDMPDANFDRYFDEVKTQYPWIDDAVLMDYVRNYGTCVHTLLDGSTEPSHLGQSFGPQLYQVEVDYLVRHEWAQSVDDIVWRRTKKGLSMSADDLDRLREYLGSMAERATGSDAA